MQQNPILGNAPVLTGQGSTVGYINWAEPSSNAFSQTLSCLSTTATYSYSFTFANLGSNIVSGECLVKSYFNGVVFDQFSVGTTASQPQPRQVLALSPPSSSGTLMLELDCEGANNGATGGFWFDNIQVFQNTGCQVVIT